MSETGRTVEVGAGSPAAPVRPRLLYATPTAGHPRRGFTTSMPAVRMMTRRFDHRPEDFVFTSGPVQLARVNIAHHALAGGYDYVLMHDDDLVIDHQRNPLDKFLDIFEKDSAVGVVAAVYLREHPMIPTLTMWHPEAKGTTEAPGDVVNVVCNLPREPFAVAGAGTGFMLIKVDVFRKVADVTGDLDPFMFWPYVTQWGGNAVLGEDFYFCWRAQQAGYKVIADPQINTVHEKEVSGRLEYRQFDWDPQDGKREHKIAMPDEISAKIITVGGISCIDVSETRRREGAEARAARERKAA